MNKSICTLFLLLITTLSFSQTGETTPIESSRWQAGASFNIGASAGTIAEDYPFLIGGTASLKYYFTPHYSFGLNAGVIKFPLKNIVS